jgi:DNA integrity scanning protein DisA with diadenylate cyclase activity
MTTESEHDFPRSIGNPATNALLFAGYNRLEQLTKVSAKEILALHGVGPKAIRLLRETLAEKGMSFANEPSA